MSVIFTQVLDSYWFRRRGSNSPDPRITNADTECLNGLIQVSKNRGPLLVPRYTIAPSMPGGRPVWTAVFVPEHALTGRWRTELLHDWQRHRFRKPDSEGWLRWLERRYNRALATTHGWFGRPLSRCARGLIGTRRASIRKRLVRGPNRASDRRRRPG